MDSRTLEALPYVNNEKVKDFFTSLYTARAWYGYKGISTFSESLSKYQGIKDNLSDKEIKSIDTYLSNFFLEIANTHSDYEAFCIAKKLGIFDFDLYFNYGKKLYHTKKDEGIEIIKEVARTGNPEAIFFIAYNYYGKSLRIEDNQNYRKIIKYLAKSGYKKAIGEIDRINNEIKTSSYFESFGFQPPELNLDDAPDNIEELLKPSTDII